jgi:hypothetical protein
MDVSLTVQMQALAGYQPAATAPRPSASTRSRRSRGPEPAAPPTTRASAESAAKLMALLIDNQCSEQSIAAIIQADPLAVASGANTDAQGAAYLSLVAGRLPDPAGRTSAAGCGPPGGSLPPGLGLEHRFSVTVGSKSGPPFSLLGDRWPGRRLERFDSDVLARAPVSKRARLPTSARRRSATSMISGSGPPHP